MEEKKLKAFLEAIIEHMPEDWLRLTTHRLDIYNESLAKTEFLVHFEGLFNTNDTSAKALNALPTAFDYIRLGHPLSSVLEWAVAKQLRLKPENVISFSSRTMPLMAVLRKNLLDQKSTQIAYSGALPPHFDPDTIRQVYGYEFELLQVNSPAEIPPFEGSTIFLAQTGDLFHIDLNASIGFHVSSDPRFGSIIVANGEENQDYISEIQHVRRRESIAMTPADCLVALKQWLGLEVEPGISDVVQKKDSVHDSIRRITGADSPIVVGSSGLSIQYAIVMGLIHDAMENHAGHPIRLIIPPNCYGGTNDQARRVAACLDNVEIVDLPVDRDHDMVQSVDLVLSVIAEEDAVPLIIVEIPTNPRVEVPDLEQLQAALSKPRYNALGKPAIEPVFILDQTFCPNFHFLGENDILASIRTISYVSGSKFPSGGLCTAGYAQSNQKAKGLMGKIAQHLKLCDNEATDLQIGILARQLPSMVRRIADAYQNTRGFVNFIQGVLPEAKINFVSEELAERGFTPSVFSLDLPTKGETHEERENYKRALNHKLIEMMITRIPGESKYCVSYGQLKGCYWTIPATSTQGTTKEEDKDYIARVACSPEMSLEKHKQVFQDFVQKHITGK